MALPMDVILSYPTSFMPAIPSIWCLQEGRARMVPYMKALRFLLMAVAAALLSWLIIRLIFPAPRIVVVAGIPRYSGDGIPATETFLNRCEDICVDKNGNVYIADVYRVRKVDSKTGLISTVAGTGISGYNGDGIPATEARIDGPSSMLLDSEGNLLMSCWARIRKVDAKTGIISTYAGTGEYAYSGEDIPALKAKIGGGHMALDKEGNLYLSEGSWNRIRVIRAKTMMVETFAGNGKSGRSDDGELARNGYVNQTNGIAVDGKGNVYFAEGCRIRMIDTQGRFRTIAGTEKPGYNGDGIPAKSASLGWLESGIRLDGRGSLLIPDWGNKRLRKVNLRTGVIITVAGGGKGRTGGYKDGIPGTKASLNSPSAVDVDGTGNLYLLDVFDYRVLKVDAKAGLITTVAGAGVATHDRDGIPATSVWLWPSHGVAFDNSGNLYISQGWSIRRIDFGTGRIRTVAGDDSYRRGGSGKPAAKKAIGLADGIALDSKGNIYTADTGSSLIRCIDAVSGRVRIVAGTDKRGYNGDDIPANKAQLNVPIAVTFDSKGNLYIADQQSYRIRKVDSRTGIITTVAGNGQNKWGSDGIKATSSSLSHPSGVVCNARGDLFILDSGTGRVRKVDAQTGLISTVAGGGKLKPFMPGLKATAYRLDWFYGIAIDKEENLYLAQTWQESRIYKVSAQSGRLWFLAGRGEQGWNGDNISATKACLHSPMGLALDPKGNLYVSDSDNYCVRKIIFHK